MDCNSPGSSVHGISQARILEWVGISFSRGSSQPKDLPNPAYKQILFYWATREAPNYTLVKNKTKPYTLISIYLLNHLLLSPGLHLGNGLFCILPSFYYLTIHLPIHGNPPASSFQFPSILQGPQILHLPFTFLCVGQSAFELWTKCFLLFSYGTYI